MEPKVQGQDVGLLDALAAELRTVLTEARTLTALLSLDLPSLDAVMKRAGSHRQQLPSHLNQAIAQLPDPVYRSAAGDLFPLPYGDSGWPKLAVRGRQAGSRFDISYDGFRRSSEGRLSRLDEVVRQVAASLATVLDGHSDDASGVTEHADVTLALPIAPNMRAPAASRGSHRPIRRLWPAFVVLLAILVGATAWIARQDTVTTKNPGALASTFLPTGCQTSVGILDGDVSTEPDAPKLISRLVSTYHSAGDPKMLGCPSAAAYHWQSIVVQEMFRDGHNSGALLASPNGVDLYLNNAAWGAYHQLGGKTGDVAQSTAGLPVRMVPYADGHIEIELSAGVVLVAEKVDAPYFWIPAVFVSWWRDHKAQVGLPTGNPLPTFRQDFQKGFVSVNPPQIAVPILTAVANPQDELPTLDSISGHILREPDGTAWYVSATVQRQWIADGSTWDCLGGNGKRIGPDLPGYAVGSLPFGGQAVCSS